MVILWESSHVSSLAIPADPVLAISSCILHRRFHDVRLRSSIKEVHSIPHRLFPSAWARAEVSGSHGHQHPHAALRLFAFRYLSKSFFLHQRASINHLWMVTSAVKHCCLGATEAARRQHSCTHRISRQDLMAVLIDTTSYSLPVKHVCAL